MKSVGHDVYIFGVLLALLLISGCGGTIEIRQTVNSTGGMTGYMNGTFDLTQLYQQQNASYSDYSKVDEGAKSIICKQITDMINGTNTTCDLRNAILTFKGTKQGTQLNESEGFTVKKGWFATEYILNSNSSGFASGNSSMNRTQLADLRDKGISIKYTIEMPGDVTDVVGGKIVGDGKKVAQIDMMDVMMQEANITVRSMEFTGLLGYIILAASASMILVPLSRRLLNIKEKALYREKPGTWMLMLFYLPGSLVMFCGAALGFFVIGKDAQTTSMFGAFFFSMAFALLILQYLGTDFAVSEKRIVIKTAFHKRIIPFSSIRKVERAKAGIGLCGIRPCYLVTTTSGTKIKPAYLGRGNGLRWNKGVLITQKDGMTTYYPVRDAGWVIDAVKG